MTKETKWYNQYIKDIDITNITYLVLTDDELQEFYKQNYFDSENNCYVHSIKDDKINPLGLYYLTFEKLPGLKYLLGVVSNNINKLTIVSALVFNDNYYLYGDQLEPITYFSTIETNEYFRNLGLFKQLIKAGLKYLNPNQNILISSESEMGKLCHTEEITINLFKKHNFKKDIRSDTNNFDLDEYHKLLKRTKK